MAGRLSEEYNVLLLEAGGSPPPAADVSNFQTRVARHPSINTFFHSVPQANGRVSSLSVTKDHCNPQHNT